jgi:monofunctional biosynthetic peptidoglycan transglycosylase
MARKTNSKSQVWKKGLVLVSKIALILFLVQLLLVLFLRWFPIYFTPLIAIRGLEKLGQNKSVGYSKTWVSYEEISDHLKVAVICAEDQNFFKHHGFDLGAIEKAMEYNEKQKKKGREKRRGASTISQQTAKNVFLWPGRSWLRKGLEIFFTIEIELLWGKHRILEVYLNVIELGDGVYGAEAAAQRFWKKNALKLSREEAALLASVLPSPRKYSAAKPGPYVRQRSHWVQQQMRYNHEKYKQL